jgi:hypothetical protein
MEKPDPDGNGLLVINDVLYAVSENRVKGVRIGFTLRNLKTEAVYQVNLNWVCTCPDVQYRNVRCKHSQALQAALRHIGDV